MQRLRITFSKRGVARFIGNLDLHRAWERTLRRAGVQMVYSQGYHPTPKLQLASALPLGITSEAEVLDVWMQDAIEVETFAPGVAAVLPSGITVLKVISVGIHEKSLQSRLFAAEYTVDPSEKYSAHVLENKVVKILARDTIVRKRRGKNYDLRKLIENMQVCCESHGKVTLRMRLTARAGHTGRPEEVLDAMGVSGVQIHRTGLFFVDKAD